MKAKNYEFRDGNSLEKGKHVALSEKKIPSLTEKRPVSFTFKWIINRISINCRIFSIFKSVDEND